MMLFKRFHKFNESHTKDEDDFKDIFIDLIHIGFDLRVEKRYFDVLGNRESKTPGYKVIIKKNLGESNKSVDIGSVKEILDILDECNSRLSDYGSFITDKISFTPSLFHIEYLLLDKESKEFDVNTKDGFDKFTKIRKFIDFINDV